MSPYIWHATPMLVKPQHHKHTTHSLHASCTINLKYVQPSALLHQALECHAASTRGIRCKANAILVHTAVLMHQHEGAGTVWSMQHICSARLQQCAAAIQPNAACSSRTAWLVYTSSTICSMRAGSADLHGCCKYTPSSAILQQHMLHGVQLIDNNLNSIENAWCGDGAPAAHQPGHAEQVHQSEFALVAWCKCCAVMTCCAYCEAPASCCPPCLRHTQAVCAAVVQCSQAHSSCG